MGEQVTHMHSCPHPTKAMQLSSLWQMLQVLPASDLRDPFTARVGASGTVAAGAGWAEYAGLDSAPLSRPPAWLSLRGLLHDQKA